MTLTQLAIEMDLRGIGWAPGSRFRDSSGVSIGDWTGIDQTARRGRIRFCCIMGAVQLLHAYEAELQAERIANRIGLRSAISLNDQYAWSFWDFATVQQEQDLLETQWGDPGWVSLERGAIGEPIMGHPGFKRT